MTLFKQYTFFLIFFICVYGYNQTITYKKYENKHIEFEYPDNWKFEEIESSKVEVLIKITPPDSIGYVGITISPMIVENATFEDKVNMFIHNFQTQSNLKVEDKKIVSDNKISYKLSMEDTSTNILYKGYYDFYQKQGDYVYMIMENIPKSQFDNKKLMKPWLKILKSIKIK